MNGSSYTFNFPKRHEVYIISKHYSDYSDKITCCFAFKGLFSTNEQTNAMQTKNQV